MDYEASTPPHALHHIAYKRLSQCRPVKVIHLKPPYPCLHTRPSFQSLYSSSFFFPELPSNFARNSGGTVGIYFRSLSRFTPPYPAPYPSLRSTLVGSPKFNMCDGSIKSWSLSISSSSTLTPTPT